MKGSLMYYISTESIVKAYKALTEKEVRNGNIFFTFLLLKSIGANKLTYVNLEKIKDSYDFAYKISGLFLPNENWPPASDFINPFSMKEIGNNPTELLKKWISGRVKNNIVGGATTWRNIIMQEENPDTFKFKYDYIKEISSLIFDRNEKIDLSALAIWANRFTEFDSPIAISVLIEDFKKVTRLTPEEMSTFFKINNVDYLSFYNYPHDAAQIRQLISHSTMNTEWVFSEKIGGTTSTPYRRFNMSNSATTKEGLLKTLQTYKQVILVGPPGTSKSYLVKQISSNFTKTINVQFHPQYTYQQFVGGYKVEKSDVVYRKGIMLSLIDEAIKFPQNKYLLIIDEINRANTSQVFGDMIQCLDRGTTVEILVEDKTQKYSIPNNIYLVGTMNSTDRTIGTLDYALKRRFMSVYFPSVPELLLDLCPSDNFISSSGLLKKINHALNGVLANKEFVVGHAVFLDESVKRGDKFVWTFETFETMFNYKILPMIEDYCSNNYSQIASVLGPELPKRLQGAEFREALIAFVK